MKTDKEGLAGIVAESFCKLILEQDSRYSMIISMGFGSDADTQYKNDFWFYKDYKQWQCDVKGSIKWPNCCISVPVGLGVDGHPFFKDERGYFAFPFKDEHYVYLVNGKALWNNVISRRKDILSAKYHVICMQNIEKCLPATAYDKIAIRGKYKTFGSFFNACFKGNEIENMEYEQVIQYARTTVVDICKKAIIDYDIPQD